MPMNTFVVSLYDLCKAVVLKTKHSLNDIEQLEQCIPQQILKDLIKCHQTNCVTVLVCYIQQENFKVCRGCFPINPINYLDSNEVVFFDTWKLGSNYDKHKCEICQQSCIEQTELRCSC